jgi:hypothetical protein
MASVRCRVELPVRRRQITTDGVIVHEQPRGHLVGRVAVGQELERVRLALRDEVVLDARGRGQLSQHRTGQVGREHDVAVGDLLHRRHDLLHREVLGEIGAGAGTYRPRDQRRVFVHGHHDDAQLRVVRTQRASDLDAVRAWKRDIHEDHAGAELFDQS